MPNLENVSFLNNDKMINNEIIILKIHIAGLVYPNVISLKCDFPKENLFYNENNNYNILDLYSG